MRPPPAAALPRRRLDELARAVPGAALHGAPVTVTGTTHDSRAVRPGDLFVAAPGARVHGAEHAGAAVAAGAAAVLTDAAGQDFAAATGATVLVVPDVAGAAGPLASALHGRPSHHLDVIGVTGTDGKTTTCWLVAAALEACGVTTGVIGSLGTRLGEEVLLTDPPQLRRTTPEAPDLQATLALLHDRGARAVAVEASSHGLALGRTAGTRFAVGIFTNLGHEHLDFHGDLEAYFRAKSRLLEASEHAVISVDDAHGAVLARRLVEAGRPVTTVSVEGASGADGARPLASPVPLDVAAAAWRAVDVVAGPQGSTFTAVGPGDEAVPVELALSGLFNVANALAALAAATALGMPAAVAARGLGGLAAVPGRMEWVHGPEDDVAALVDYAHTPGALSALLRAARAGTAPGGRVLLVLGTGGGRDDSKRPLIAKAAGRGADVVVITDDNPRDEDPASLRAALRAAIDAAGVAQPAELHEAADREDAVALAVGLARPGDVVVAAGNRADRLQVVGAGVQPVDEPAALRRALAGRRRLAS